MMKNYLLIAWRNLRKNKTFSIINITGLSFSVAFCLLIFLYIRHEQSYDSFHGNKDRIYRLEMSNIYTTTTADKSKSIFSFLTKADDIENQLVFPLVVSGDMQHAFPEIKNVIRFKDNGEEPFKINNQVFKEKHTLYADSNFFTTFSFPLVQGNAKTALNSINNIVVSQTVAKKYFGNQNAVGKTILLVNDNQLFTVSGVVKDAPENSSIQFDLIIPLTSDPSYNDRIKGGFNSASHFCMIELTPGTNPEQFETKMNKWVEGYYTKPFVASYGKYYKDFDFKTFHWTMRPLADCHYNIAKPWGHYTDAKNIYQLSSLVIIILLIAALNYILLVIANAAARSQEVGVR